MVFDYRTMYQSLCFRPSISLCLASIGFVGTAYLQLHILSGLELATDSFTMRVFRDMDFEEAVEECVLQAMLRHVPQS